MQSNRWSTREMRDMRVKDIVGKAMLGELSWKQAEQILGYSARHMRRLKERCTVDPKSDLRDRRHGRVMPQRMSDKVVKQILKLRQERYYDFNVKHFHEVLQENHGLTVSYTYVKTLLQKAGYAERAKARGKHRRKRDRRPQVGMMLHLDGSEHAWLGAERGRWDLIYLLDDADGRALYGRFVPEEDTRSCLAALQHVLKEYGLFPELYIDRGSHFVCTQKAGGPLSEAHVQFARVLRSLHIRPIYAYSPQARGRSERAFRTVQGRLPQMLREAGIQDWDSANQYLQTIFIPEFNRKFTVTPLEQGSAFIPLVGMNIERACALEHDVTIGNDNCVRWHKRVFQIPPHPSRISFAKCRALLVEYLDGHLSIEYGQQTLARFDARGTLIQPKTPTKKQPPKSRKVA